MTILVAVDKALLRCSRSTLLRIIYMQVDSLLALALTARSYAKLQPRLDALNVGYLELEAVLDR